MDRDGRRVRPYMIDARPRPFVEPLTCAFCTQQVRPVRSYSKHGGVVGPYFRLIAHGEHDAECDLYPTRVLEEIARGSHGLASVAADGTLRLTLPDEDALVLDPPAEDVGQDGAGRAALWITTTRPWLPPALGSAVKIARFLRQCDFDPDAIRRFKVLHGARTLAWSAFCFGPDYDALALLHKRVASTKHGHRLPHPVAVHGTVVRCGESSTGKPFVVLALDIIPVAGAPGRKVEVVLRSDHPTLLKPLTPGRHVLAVGDRWKIFSRKTTEEVQLWIEEHWSLASWSWDEETGTAGEPECPPALSPAQRQSAASVQRQRQRGNKRTVDQRLDAGYKPASRAGTGKRLGSRSPAVRPGPRRITPPVSTNGAQGSSPAPREVAPSTQAGQDSATAPPRRDSGPRPSAEATDTHTQGPAAVSSGTEGGASAAPSAPPMPSHPPRPADRPAPVPPPVVPASVQPRTAKAGLRRLLGRWRGER
jgi:hypothetical protein